MFCLSLFWYIFLRLKLGIRDNQLVELPREIGELTRLRELHIQNNRLTILPPEVGKCNDQMWLVRPLRLSSDRWINFDLFQVFLICKAAKRFSKWKKMNGFLSFKSSICLELTMCWTTFKRKRTECKFYTNSIELNWNK